MKTPREVTREQAIRVRLRWRDAQWRADAARVLDQRTPNDPTTATWRAVLRGDHPLVAWLDGDADVESLPCLFPDGSSPRQLFASNPFPGPSRWSSQAISIAS